MAETPKPADAPTFEEALKRLEGIVAQLEKPDVTLDQTLALFQEGKRLSELCQQRLTAVEQKVSLLLDGETGDLHLADFDEPENEERNP